MSVELRRVADLAEQVRGVSYSKADVSLEPQEGYVPVLRAGNISDSGLEFDDLVYVPKAKVKGKQLVRANDIVIAASSGSLDVVGKAARALNDFHGGFGAFCKVLRPAKDIEPSYFAHYFKTNEYRRKVSNLAAGANINNLRNGDLDELLIPVPPLKEQKRIAKILDAADALRAKRRESLAQLDALLQSAFLDLFGDPVRNEKGWDKINIGNIARSKPNNGVFRKNNEYSERGGHGVPVIWLEELFKGSCLDVKSARRLALDTKELDKYGLCYGDVLFCRSSLKLDGIAYNNVYLGEDGAAAFECHLIRVSPDLSKCNPIFFSAQLRTPPLRACLKSVSKTSTMTTIDQKAICAVDVIVPPMELQNKFANLSKAVDLEKDKIRKAIFELDSLFLSLQQRAFSGEL